mgnify:CR=1 FL=1
MSNVQSMFKKISKQNDDLKIKSEVIISEEILDKSEILSHYTFDFEIDSETLDYLKDITYELHKETKNFYTKMGKLLSETQEKLSNNKTGVFKKWFESIGLKKDFVYDNISRYKYIVGLSDNIKNKFQIPVIHLISHFDFDHISINNIISSIFLIVFNHHSILKTVCHL